LPNPNASGNNTPGCQHHFLTIRSDEQWTRVKPKINNNCSSHFSKTQGKITIHKFNEIGFVLYGAELELNPY
jgi:hypothetical protein